MAIDPELLRAPASTGSAEERVAEARARARGRGPKERSSVTDTRPSRSLWVWIIGAALFAGIWFGVSEYQQRTWLRENLEVAKGLRPAKVILPRAR